MSANLERAKKNIDVINAFVIQAGQGNLNDYREMLKMLCSRYAGDSRIRVVSAEVDKGFFRWWFMFYCAVADTLEAGYQMSNEAINDFIFNIWDAMFDNFFTKANEENKESILRSIATKGYMETHLIHSFIQTVAGHTMVAIFMQMYHFDVKESEELYFYCLNKYWNKSLSGETLRVML